MIALNLTLVAASIKTYQLLIDVCCSGIVAEKTDSELFFVDKNAISCDTSEGECTA